MKAYQEMTREELLKEKEVLEAEYGNIRNVAYSLICRGESRRRSSLTCRWG